MLRCWRIALIRSSSLASPPPSSAASASNTVVSRSSSSSRAAAATAASAAPASVPSASATATAAAHSISSPFADIQSSMHRSYRYDMVLSKMSRGGLILARQENAQTYSFAGFDGVAPLDVARRILQVPISHRTFHVVVGRPCVPCDFFGDIDLAASTSDEDFARLILKAVTIVEAELLAAAARVSSSATTTTTNNNNGSRSRSVRDGGVGKNGDSASSQTVSAAAPPDVSLFVNPSTTKRSAHLHISFPSLCLQDYRACRVVAERVNEQLGITLFDLGCCRDKGMLRLGYNCKLPDAETHVPWAHGGGDKMLPLVPYGTTMNRTTVASSTSASCVALRRTLEKFLSLPTEAQLARTFCLREDHLPSKLTSSPSSSSDAAATSNSAASPGDQSSLRTSVSTGSANASETSRRSAAKSKAPNGLNGSRRRDAVHTVAVDCVGGDTNRSTPATVLCLTALYEGTTVKERRKNATFDPSSFAPMKRGGGASVEVDAQGRPIPAFLRESTKPRRYQEAVTSLRALPSHVADHYDPWIRVGLALHNFSSENTQFEEWVLFSLRCPKKFSRDVCRKFWDKFHRNPDHANWRRGYNYLVKSIWRDLGISRK